MLQGQWYGSFSGSFTGKCSVNVEEINNEIIFYCYLISENNTHPSLFSYFRVDNNKINDEIRAFDNLSPIDGNYHIVPKNQKEQYINTYYQNIILPKELKIQIKYSDPILNINTLTEINTEIKLSLKRNYSEQYKLEAQDISWDEFKRMMNSIQYRKVAFRGQKNTWPLRTSFHRTDRCDVIEYSFHDIPMLHRHLSSLTKHYFDLSDNQHYGAFFNLIQHHGYPTPLLDWSYSPYVAAFFAFHQINKEEVQKGELGRKARIFIFESDLWRKDFPQFFSIGDCRLHLSIGEYLALNNTRSLPQQALTTLTNLFDIEGYLYECGKMTGRTYLHAYDISLHETPKVISELALMGITYGSLFPGLDGACADIRKINFPEI